MTEEGAAAVRRLVADSLNGNVSVDLLLGLGGTEQVLTVSKDGNLEAADGSVVSAKEAGIAVTNMEASYKQQEEILEKAQEEALEEARKKQQASQIKEESESKGHTHSFIDAGQELRLCRGESTGVIIGCYMIPKKICACGQVECDHTTWLERWDHDAKLQDGEYCSRCGYDKNGNPQSSSTEPNNSDPSSGAESE